MRGMNIDCMLGMTSIIEHGKPMICRDPWMIVCTRPQAEHMAAESLRRDGFEVFLPLGRQVGLMPLRFVPPKKRKLRRRILREDVCLPYPGYLFARRLASKTSLFRLYEISGVAGLCCFGERLATLSDYRVELLRLAMDAGEFDSWQPGLSARDYHLAEIISTALARKVWNGSRKISSYVDDSARTVHLIEEFGRITRVLGPAEEFL